MYSQLMLQKSENYDYVKNLLIAGSARRLVFALINLTNMSTFLLHKLHKGSNGKGMLLNYLIARIFLGVACSWCMHCRMGRNKCTCG